MVLVAYSDSEGSDAEVSTPLPAPSKPTPATKSSTNFTIDKANPSKIRVNLSSSLPQSTTDREDGEPSAKRARTSGAGGAFSGFNAMLPAPKRDNVKPGTTNMNGNKLPARKVFSLKTGAEPAFSRESDAEMKDFFAEQEQDHAQDVGGSGGKENGTTTIPNDIPKPSFITESNLPQTTGKAFMFKPLSVSRGPKKKKTISQLTKGITPPIERTAKSSTTTTQTTPENTSTNINSTSSVSNPKISLFSSGPSELPPDPEPDESYGDQDEEDEIVEILDDPLTTGANGNYMSSSSAQPESLTSIADNLNLTAAERRQLLGRKGQIDSMVKDSHNIITFNTDTEYATNQALNASADASVQHNPVRAIAGGKHSLKQLVANAQGQKEALEESFAMGRRNKREAGTKYGW